MHDKLISRLLKLQTVVFVWSFHLLSKPWLKRWMMLCSCCTLRYISDCIQYFSFSSNNWIAYIYTIYIWFHAAEASHRQCCIVGWRAWQFPQHVSLFVKWLVSGLMKLFFCLKTYSNTIKIIILWRVIYIVCFYEQMCYTDRMCRCKESNDEGEARLQRAILSHALQVCRLLISESFIQSFTFFPLLWNVLSQHLFTEQESLDELMIKRRWYGDREDFTVIVQNTPFITGPSSVSSLASLVKLYWSGGEC